MSISHKEQPTEVGHISVLLKETVEGLNVTTGDVVVDCTIGGAGHSKALLADAKARLQSDITLIGLDADSEAIDRGKIVLSEYFSSNQTSSQIILRQSNFRSIKIVLDDVKISEVNKVLMDLGLSSFQLDASNRGFSFRYNQPLSMAFGESKFTARDIVNDWDEENIADIIYAYGEEHFSRRIASAIVEARAVQKIETTDQLVSIIESAVPGWYKRKGKAHPATKTFQALRMAVNDELQALTDALDAVIEMLAPEGRIAVISFHSLEDRIVKRYFKQWEVDGKGKRVNKKAIAPSRGEVIENPRSRSAKLRIFQKI